MSNKDESVNEMEAILLEKRRKLKQELNDLNRKAKNSLCSSTRVHSDHFADCAANLDVSLNLIPNKIKQIRACDEALQRIKEGIYGTCELCKEPIPIGRLKVIPFAKTCTKCKESANQEKTISFNGSHRKISQKPAVYVQ